MKVSTRTLYQHCYGQYALAAVNICFMEQMIGLFSAASEADSPIIVQTTPFQRKYSSPIMLNAMAEAASQMYPKVVYAMHLDHGDDEHVFDAIHSGYYTSVMIDASHDSYTNNIARTKKVVDQAHQNRISVEAELGVLGGVEDNLTIAEEKAFYTDPAEVEEFVAATGCDSLAIAVGTSHGAYKFSGGQGLQFHIMEEINKRLPQYPLVLHGGSSVDPKEVERINAAGGQLKATAKGVDPKEIQESIRYGVCKVNLATDFRLLWTRVARETFRDCPDIFTPATIGQEYMDEYKKLMFEKFDLLQSAGQGSLLKKYLSDG